MSDSPFRAEGRADELVIAVYLDTLVLLDLLAAAEDGFAMAERVTSMLGTSVANERSGSAEFGVPKVLNFFKLGFSGKLGRTATNDNRQSREAELTHTYGSLLHRLRAYLLEEGLVTRLDGSSNVSDVSIGSFIEFAGVARANPFTDSFRRIGRMLKFVEIAMTAQSPGAPARNPQGGGGRQAQRQPNQGQPPRSRNSDAAQLKAISDFLEQITIDVEREGTSTLVVDSVTSGYRAVVTVFNDYLRDRSMAEILNREFRVLGKVARHLPAGSAEAVDLIASSGISGFPPELLAQLGGAIDLLGSSGSQLSNPTTSIDPPAIEIVPIAIYL